MVATTLSLLTLVVTASFVPFQSDLGHLKYKALSGDTSAQLELGRIHEEGAQGVSKDLDEAGRWFRLAAENGDAEGQFQLGRLFLVQVIEKAVRPGDDLDFIAWLTKAAQQGHASAQGMLGSLYSSWKNHEEAVRWHTAAAGSGLSSSQISVGIALREGKGAAKDSRAALEWFKKAAEQGDAGGQLYLAQMHRDGEGLPQPDYGTAAKWFKASAEQGVKQAQHSLAELYFQGKGVPQDFVMAYMWANLAASSETGSENAAVWMYNMSWSLEAGPRMSRINRGWYAEHMTPEQIAEAQRLTREWKPKHL